MATILTTTTSDYHGNVTVTKQVLTPTQVAARGRISKKAAAAHSEGRGRRNRSAYAAKALGSGRGVLASEDAEFTDSPDLRPQEYRNAFSTLSEHAEAVSLYRASQQRAFDPQPARRS
jgi:hypothetical protein